MDEGTSRTNEALSAFAAGERLAVLSSLVASAHGDFDAAETALSESIARAVAHWPTDGVPDRPAGWIFTVARRTLIDAARANARWHSAKADGDTQQATDSISNADDRLALIFTCCHPALSHIAGVTLALRTIGGLSTREIARALMEPEATTAQRLVRAKRKIRDARIPFRVPAASHRPERAAAVRETLYLVFNEGYGATEGNEFVRAPVLADAIRLGRLLVDALPNDAESIGLLALMLLHGARRDTRVGHDSAIVPLEAQDRRRWHRREIREGEYLLARAMRLGETGPYQLQAAIAALHATAPTAADTDWRQIALLYGALRFWLPTPVVELNAAVALAMVHGPEWGLAQLDGLARERGMASYHLLPAARADLLRRAGRGPEAAVAYRDAIALARHSAERVYLERRLAEVQQTPSRAERTRP